MAKSALQGMRVAILATDGFEQVELMEPKRALEDAGAATFVVGPTDDKVKGRRGDSWGIQLPVDIPLKSAKAADFHALLLPGVELTPEIVPPDQHALRLVREFVDGGKPVAAVCHGPRTLLEAGAVRGRIMTSAPSLESDLKNAGANWVDQDVVSDGNLVTCRDPEDLPAFDQEMLRMFTHERNHSTEMRKIY